MWQTFRVNTVLQLKLAPVGQSSDSGQAGIVGAISTLEHRRGLVAGRSCSLVADTGMVTHERFWAEFLGAQSSMCQVTVCSIVFVGISLSSVSSSLTGIFTQSMN